MPSKEGLWGQNVSAPGVLNCRTAAFPSQRVGPRCFLLCNLWWLSFSFISGKRFGFSLNRIYKHLREFLWVIASRNSGCCASINLTLHLHEKSVYEMVGFCWSSSPACCLVLQICVVFNVFAESRIALGYLTHTCRKCSMEVLLSKYVWC